MTTKPISKGRRLTFRELKEKGIRESRMTIWRRVKDKEFPEPIVDHGRTYWFEDEIDAHLARLENLPRGSGTRPPPKKEEPVRISPTGIEKKNKPPHDDAAAKAMDAVVTAVEKLFRPFRKCEKIEN